MQIKYLINLLLKKILLQDFFCFLTKKQFIYTEELGFFIHYSLYVDNYIYYNYFTSSFSDVDLFNDENYFDLLYNFEINYNHFLPFIPLFNFFNN